ncbi:DotU family type IV/VI secretion system protein [Enterobacter hormaechei]|nr:DotU family type IV/VI secretion system protein [Enterobacter hormaechei]
MNDRKRATAAFIDIDALLQDTWLQVISLRHGPTFQDGEGRTLWERCIDDVGRVQRELKASELDEASPANIFLRYCALMDEASKVAVWRMTPVYSGMTFPLQGGYFSAPWTPVTRYAIGCVMCCVNRLLTTPL